MESEQPIISPVNLTHSGFYWWNLLVSCLFFLEIPTFPFLLFYLVTQVSLQSLFLPNDHLPPLIFFQEANDFDLSSYNADTASGLHSVKDLYCEHTFLLPDA